MGWSLDSSLAVQMVSQQRDSSSPLRSSPPGAQLIPAGPGVRSSICEPTRSSLPAGLCQGTLLGPQGSGSKCHLL